MNIQIIAPPPSLKNYVRYFFALEKVTDDTSRKDFTVMCSGEPGLIFQQNTKVITGFNGEQLPQLFVFGQATKYGQLSSSGSFRTIGVSFQPTALKPLFKIPANELTNQNISFDNLLRTSLTEQLLNSQSVPEQANYLFDFLLTQAGAQQGENKKLNYAVNALQQQKKLGDILKDLNLTERSLERIFLTHVGIPPILYARICRFQHSLALLRLGKPQSLTDIAHRLGYFDQSHFIRDFKMFAGVSPRIYLRKATENLPGLSEWQ